MTFKKNKCLLSIMSNIRILLLYPVNEDIAKGLFENTPRPR